jgi:hypothetical protein
MFNLVVALVIILVIFCIIVLLFTVNNTIIQLERGTTSFLNSVWASLFSVIALLVLIPTTLLQGGISVGSTLFTNYKTVIVLSTLIVGGSVTAAYSIKAFQVADSVYTPILAPLYIQVFVPIINIVRMFLDIIICWYNFAVTFFTQMATELRKIFFNCIRVDSQLIATRGRDLTISLLDSTLVFFGSAFTRPFPIRNIVLKIGGFVSALANPYVCACEDLSFVYDIFNQTINSENLADGLDNTSALIFNIAKPIVQFGKGLFFSLPSTPFQCNQSSPDYILCQISRPPKLNDAVVSACKAGQGFGEWIIYDIFKAVISSFFDIQDQDAIPDLSGVAYGPICAIITAVEIPIDIIFHFDLVLNYIWDCPTPLLKERTYSCPR